jgi:hypothetical protein
MTIALDEIIGTPYVPGGRRAGSALDCLGVAILVCHFHGIALPDPWETVRDAWESGTLDVEALFPASWDRVDAVAGELADGDILLKPKHIAVHSGGYVYGTTQGGTAFREPAARFLRRNPAAVSVWRQTR